MISGHKFQAVWAKIGGTQIWESREQKLLGVDLEIDLNSDKFLIIVLLKIRENKSREKIKYFSKAINFFLI